MLRVLFFGTGGETSARALGALADGHRVVGIVRAEPRHTGAHHPGFLRTLAARLLRRDGHAAAAARARSPVHRFTAAEPAHFASLARATRADLICIAGFPWLLPRAVYEAAPLGAVNLHGSLLPRHRGVLPLFWIYYLDDRVAGVTVHRIDEGADTGDVLAQDALPLPRGLPVDTLARRNAVRGATLLRTVVDALEAGTARATPQDHARATHAPRPGGEAMIRFDDWDVERVWHFLAGLERRYHEPLRDSAGRAIAYGRVLGWERCGHGRAPGSVDPSREGYTLHCAGGVIHLQAADRRGRGP